MFVDNLVIGSTIESAFYSFMTDALFINTRIDPPMFYRQCSVSLFGEKREPKIWSRLSFMLSLLGRKIDACPETMLKLSENSITIIKEGNKQEHHFETCFVFDPTRIRMENEILKAMPETYMVIDDLEISCLGSKYQEIQNKNKQQDIPGFAEMVNFYSSDRIPGAKYITDCVVQSTLNVEQLYDYNYSDTMVKFYVEKHLSHYGIDGRFMKFYKNGKPKYRKPNVKHVKRMVFKRDNNKYQDSKFIKFISPSIKEILNE
jgi:hypothetical protein